MRNKAREDKAQEAKLCTCLFVGVVPAHALLSVEQFAHLLQETEVMKEADEHVRFVVPQAVPPPVFDKGKLLRALATLSLG